MLGHVYVLLAALFSFVLFDAASVPAALGTAGGLLGLGGLPLWDSGALYYLRSYAPVLALAAVGSTPLPAALCRRIAAGRAGRVLDALAACGAAGPAGGVHGVSGQRLRQSLPVFPVLRRCT